jgi:putative ABC transport system permease protein
MTKRFGADLMVVPEGTGQKAQALLLKGGIAYFYFDAGIVDKVAKTQGVECASPQFFLTSLATECCDAAVQLIAYDPATDFVIQPWIAEKHTSGVQDGQLVVGSRINVRKNGAIQLFQHEYPVAAQLSHSASGLDISIFMTMNTLRELLGRARAEGFDFLGVQEKEAARGRVSAILVKTNAEEKQSAIAAAIRRENPGVEVLTSQGIFSHIAAALSGLVTYIRVFSAALWVLAVGVLAAVFSGTIHERKKEFALLRILGAPRKKLIALVLYESSCTALSGGALGIALASLAVFPFSALISENLQLPYLDSPLAVVVPLVFANLALSALAGPLASLYAAVKISRAETYYTLREGE